jgi:hypothetical protein
MAAAGTRCSNFESPTVCLPNPRARPFKTPNIQRTYVEDFTQHSNATAAPLTQRPIAAEVKITSNHNDDLICKNRTTAECDFSGRQIVIFSCNRRANLALCRTVLRRRQARQRDWTRLWQYFGLFPTPMN